MSDADRLRWNEKYRRGDHATGELSLLLTSVAPHLPRTGRAIDVAGGAGRHSLWLAQRGLDVLLTDISDEALKIARDRAAQSDVAISTSQIDLEQEPFPRGPWNLIVSVHYLFHPLFEVYPQVLAEGGILVCVQPTKSNLQRHAKPPERFLLADQELPTLVPYLEVLHYQEGWLAAERHEAVIVARQPPQDARTDLA